MFYLIEYKKEKFKLEKKNNLLIITNLKNNEIYYIVSIVKVDFIDRINKDISLAERILEQKILSSSEKLKELGKMLRKKWDSEIKELIVRRQVLENNFDELENVIDKNKCILLIPVDVVDDYKQLNNVEIMFDIIFYIREKFILPIKRFKVVS